MTAENWSIIDITRNKAYEKYLYRCFVLPFRKYKQRQEYLKLAIAKGFHKKLLIFNEKPVGQIEYAPAEASYYPIIGDNITVMNCIWVLRKAKGHNFGKRLFANMLKSEKNAQGFATLALENHWSPWIKKEHMEKFGFESIDFVQVRHKTKHVKQCFKIHLMWQPAKNMAEPPNWDREKLLEGVKFCMAHPLYHPEKLENKEILEKC
ncbi:MAG: hypothetical protein QW146_09120 [Candidatus Bathyarchaeia archaeon]